MADQTVTYKGRQYKLLFRGKTKFGPDKAKLSFMDGSKEFWVEGSALEGAPAAASPSKKDGPACAECGRPGKLVQDLEDGMMKHYRCCDMPPRGCQD